MTLPFHSNDGFTTLKLLSQTIRQAANNNPRVNQLYAPTPNVTLGSWWANNTAYVAGENVVSFNGSGTSTNANFYVCTTPGTSNNGGANFQGPSSNGASVTDGSVVWQFLFSVKSNFFASNSVNSYLWANNAGRANTVNGPVSFYGGIPYTSGGTGYMALRTLFVNGNQLVQGQSKYSFTTDSSSISIRQFRNSANGSGIRIIVDHQYVSNTPYMAKKWTWHTMNINFGSRRMRNITIEESDGTSAFGGIDVALNEGVYPTRIPNQPTFLWSGDSYPAGGGSSHIWNAFPGIIGDMAGVRNVINTSIGGTGYLVNVASNTAIVRLPDLLQHVPLVPNPIIVDENGGNDLNFSNSQIQSASLAYMQAIRASYPNVPIISTMRSAGTSNGGNNVVGTANNTYKYAEQAKIAAIAQMNDPLIFYISPYTGPGGSWFTGTGTDSSANNDGNSDIYTSGVQPDHPNDLGHNFYAINWINALRGVMNQYNY